MELINNNLTGLEILAIKEAAKLEILEEVLEDFKTYKGNGNMDVNGLALKMVEAGVKGRITAFREITGKK